MRPLEALILLLFVVACGAMVPARRSPLWVATLPGLTLVLLVGHALVEGLRWQMAPAYALSVLLVAVALQHFVGRGSRPAPGAAGRIALAAFGLLLVLTAGAASYVFPVIALPAPTGPYAVGTETRHWVDAARAESHADDPAERRELMVQFWYPAEAAPDAERLPYLQHPDVALQALVDLGWPMLQMVEHFQLFRTNALVGAPLAQADERFPVIVYSHGLNRNRTEAMSRLEELASHGYVVLAIDHTHGADFTVFPDGRVARFVNLRRNEDTLERIDTVRTGRVRVWVEDARFALDQLAAMRVGDPQDRFAGRLDLARVGILGYSNGGTTAGLACWTDQRFKAGINLDGTSRGEVVEEGLQQPFLFMLSEAPQVSDRQLAEWGMTRQEFFAPTDLARDRAAQVLSRSKGAGYRLAIAGSAHSDFTDLPLSSPLNAALGFGGSIDSERCNRIISDYVVAFFDKHLRGKAAPLLGRGDSPYAEVAFESHRATGKRP